MIRWFSACVLAALLWLPAAAQTLKIAIPQKGNWDTGFVDYGIRQGFFREAGLDVQTVYTQGGAQTIQAVISGSVDIAMGTGILGIVGAYSKGAPVRVISSEMTTASDLYWVVKADSPIHDFKELAGHTVSYSEAGSSSNLVLLAMLAQAGVSASARPVSVGGIPNSITQLMSGQIDAAWTGVPFNLVSVRDGTLRIIGRGRDANIFKDETIRVNFTTSAALAAKSAAFDVFNKVYVKTIAWAYADPRGAQYLAEAANVPLDIARQTITEFVTEPTVQPYEMHGIDLILTQAAEFKFTAKLLTPAEVAPLFSTMLQKPR